MKPVVSVVVCTFNRSRLLRHCLDSLVTQDLNPEGFEVLVIDNASSDATGEVASEFARLCPNFRVILEPQQGLSHARNRGWREALGQYVAYIDDDARACKDWLTQMYAYIARNPSVEAFGGPFSAFWESEPPPWFPAEYGSWSLGDRERRVLVGTEFINGTNMVFQKKLLQTLGGFDAALGMSGKKISYGEETRLLVALSERGIPVYYVPKMHVEHLVAPYKMRLGWLLSSAYANGRCSGKTFNKQRGLGSHCFGICIGLAKLLSSLFGLSKNPLKRRLYYGLSGLCAEFGAFVEHFSSLGNKA